MKLISNAKYEKPLESGTIFKFRNRDFNICIHNFIHCGDTLYLDCPVLGINDHPLKSKEIFECVPEAKEIIKQKLNKLTTLFDDFYKDDHIELTRY